VSNISDIDNEPIEHDPTGVRALLGSLPDPGPMPADLVARIDAALAAEVPFQAELLEGYSDEHGPGSVIPFAAAQATRDDGILRGQTRKERRRVVLPWLAAAAAAGVLTVSGTAALHDHGGSIAAAFRGGNSSSGSAAMSSSEAHGSLAGGSSNDSSAGAARSAGEAVVVMRTGGSYTVSDLAAEAAGLRVDPTRTIPPLAAESPATGPYGTPLAVRDCAAKNGINPAAQLVADLGQIDGAPGFVVVATSDTRRTAYAFSMTCTLLAGPVALP
jgi:hypothetical protein